ncbi:MAG: hypothetical protein COY40_00205 [Alphaproteobacteria bacterium CG_4_10_14_0_8_um_filter_53_9]|nr:MAG: hypothetical protein COY40_00205 [Alphaproteobacteria bacterium CG_4_10_14_0_8_um_filter_53_9]
MSTRQETKVGLLVIAALAGLGFLSIKSGTFGTSLSSAGREIATTFSDIEGISVGSPVKMAGVVVGEVTDLKLLPDGRAKLELAIRSDVPLPADVAAQITTSGLIGERFVALVPGPQGMTGEAPALAADAASIPSLGGGGSGAGDMAGNFGAVSEDLQAITSTLRKVLGNEGNAEKIQTIIDGLSTFSAGLSTDGDDVISNLKEASESLKTILSGNEKDAQAMIGNFGKMAANMARITDRLERGEGPLGQMLMGDANGGNSMLADLSASAKDLKEVMAKINSGEGTLGKLVNDPQTAEKLDHALDTFSQVSDRVEQLRTEVAFEGYGLTNEDGVGKGTAMLTLQPRPTRFYVLGVTSDGFSGKANDNGDRNNPYFAGEFGKEAKYTAQFGHVYQDVMGSGQDVAVRIGLKDSTGGVGVDTAVPLGRTDKDVRLSADLYDFAGTNTPNSNSPHLDLKARVDVIGNTVYGMAGYDNVLNSNYGSPFVGVGMRFQDDDLKYILGQAL